MLLKVDCLPNAVGKQPSIPLIYLGRKWTLNWWWWWWMASQGGEVEGAKSISSSSPLFWGNECKLRVEPKPEAWSSQELRRSPNSRVKPKIEKGRVNVNVNWNFLMEPSRKSHAIELRLFLWHNAIWCTESVATHSSRLQPSIICMTKLQHWCSAALVPKVMTLKSEMKAQVSIETTIEPHDSVYVLPRTQTRVSRANDKFLPLDHRCLWEGAWWVPPQNIFKNSYLKTCNSARYLWEHWKLPSEVWSKAITTNNSSEFQKNALFRRSMNPL